MSVLLREDVLAWLAALFLGAATLVSALQLLSAQDRLGRVARWCGGSAGYLLLLSLIARGVQVGGWPLVSTYELVLLSAAVLALMFAISVPQRLAGLGGVCASLPALLMVVLALLLTPSGARLPQPPPPVLSGILFPLHTVTTAVGYGGLILAGGAALLRLLFSAQTFSAVSGQGDAATSLRADLEVLAWRGLSWGYPWLTLGMVIGAMWGWYAWGRYWSWSVKEALTLLTWGLFTLAFHTRRLKGWRGRPHAAVVLAGLLVLFLTLLAAEALSGRVLPTVRYIF